MLTRPVRIGNLAQDSGEPRYTHPPTSSVAGKQGNKPTTDLYGGTFPQTDGIGQVRMSTALLGVHLDQLKLVPDTVDKIVEARLS